LDIDLGSLEMEFDKSNLKLLLKDQNGQIFSHGDETNSFSLDSLMWNGNRVEMEVKLFRMARNMRFCIQIQTKDGANILTGHSIEFSTHNSGNSATKANTKMQVETVITDVPPIMLTPLTTSPVDKKRKILEDFLELPATLEDCHYQHNLEDVITVNGSLEVYGKVKARLFTQFSDIRLKTNITDIVDALEIVTKLQGKTYEWKKTENQQDSEGPRKVIGLIAQEVYTVLPEVVHEDKETGLLSVSYTELIPIIIEAFKQFLTEYEEDRTAMQMQLDDLKKKLDILSGKVDKADQDYMPNLQKAIADLKSATRNFVDSYHQYAVSLIQSEMTLVKKTAQGIANSVSGKVQYVKEVAGEASSKLQNYIPTVSEKYQSMKNSVWKLPTLIVTKSTDSG